MIIYIKYKLTKSKNDKVDVSLNVLILLTVIVLWNILLFYWNILSFPNKYVFRCT